MENVRRSLENGFGWWAAVVVRYRWAWILLMLGSAAFLTTRIPLMEVETSSENYLFDGDPSKIAYNAFREQFGRDQAIYVVIEPPEVFDLEFLEWLREFHRDIEDSVPHLDEVTSLVNVRSVYGRGQELVVDDLRRNWPSSEEAVSALRDRVMSTPSYLDSVVGSDGRVATLLVKSFAYSHRAIEGGDLAGFKEPTSRAPRKFLSARESSEYCRTVLEVVERHRRPDYVIHTTGQPLVAYALTRSMVEDIPVIFGGALVLVGALLLVLFRRWSPVLLSATLVILSLVSTIGLAQLVGFPISLPTQILPSFVLAVGVGYVVHFLVIFFRSIEQGEDRNHAIETTLRHVGLPMLMTTLTTSAGLMSFVAAEMEQALQLGLTGAMGVCVIFVVTIVLLPATLSLLPLGRLRTRGGLEGGSWLLSTCARASIHHPRKIVAAALALGVGSLALLPQLDYSADPMTYFPEDHWLRRATYYADERLGGMQSLEVVIDTKRTNGLYEVAVLDGIEAMDSLIHDLHEEGELVSRTWSMLDVLKETHQALNENRPEFYVIPRDSGLIAQELLLFENSGVDDLEDFVDTDFSKARMSIRTGWEDGVEKQRFLDRVKERIVSTMEGRAEVTLTGAVQMIARTASASSESLIQSYCLALLLITPIMVILIGSLRAGLVSMVPNLIPILAALASMVVVGIELDMFTILGACIAIGLAVDDSIHFILGFRRHLEMTGDPEIAVEMTMESTGRALLFTSVVLVAGFGVLGFSSMANLGYLGMTTAFAIGLAFVLDVTVTPALLVLTHRKVGSRARESVNPGRREDG